MRAMGIILKSLRYPLLWLLAMTAAQALILLAAVIISELNH